MIDNEDELNDLVCKYLIDEKIIGWFQDRMEFGPRALGNRSIISSPIGPNIKNLINSKIKQVRIQGKPDELLAMYEEGLIGTASRMAPGQIAQKCLCAWLRQVQVKSLQIMPD